MLSFPGRISVFLLGNSFSMSLISGVNLSVGCLISYLGFSLPVWGHVLNDSPVWGKSFCLVSDLLFDILVILFGLKVFLLGDISLNESPFWGKKSSCWASDLSFQI